MNADRDAHGVAATGGASNPIVRAQGALQPLTPRAMEERKIIHRNDSVRPQADAFRGLRTRLLGLGGERSFVTMVAPIRLRCGGSFVARNLAAAFAFDESKDAMLLDCDALHPSQHAAMGIRTASGMMDYLEGGVNDIADVQYETGLPRLRLIPSGRPRETTGEYFSSARMRMLVDSLRGTQPNRYLILDSPPVLDSPDARILSDLADLIVLVAGYGQVTAESIEKAAASFDPDKVAGVVFNDIH